MDRREHRRARLRLPVRLRWTTPFAQKIELAESMDASRDGLLVSTKESHAPGVTLWVTFPHNPSLSDGQPEVPARVVRCSEVLEVLRSRNARENDLTEDARELERAAKARQLIRALHLSDAPATFAVAVHFEMQTHAASNGNSFRTEHERRGTQRRALAVPVHVRPEVIPWFEEAMTIDFSAKGLRFRSNRDYQPGEQLCIAFEGSDSAPWRGAREFRSRVVRVAPVSNGTALEVSVCRVE